GVSEERNCRRRETERGRIEFTLVLPDALLDEARKADARVENSGRPQVVDVIERAAVVDAEKKVARRTDAVDLARPIAARLAAEVVVVADEEALFFGDDLVEAVTLRMESVRARIAAEVIARAQGIVHLHVGQGVELQIVERYRADAVGADHVEHTVALDRIAAHARSDLPRRRRIVNDDARQQSREITIAHCQRRYGARPRLLEGVLQPLICKKEETGVAPDPNGFAALAETRQHDRAAERPAVAVVARHVACRLAVLVPAERRVEVSEEVVGRQDVIANEFVGRAMQLVA